MPDNRKARVAVLISGNGSNLQALIDAAANPDYPATIELVISNKDDIYGLTRAQQAGISQHVIELKHYQSREECDEAMHEALIEFNIDYVVLAGFMRLLTPQFVNKWEGKMINIHPSLLPSFKGSHAVHDALRYGVKVTGCTVHFVTSEMDSGPIIIQSTVPVYNQDDEARLLDRIHEAEYTSLPLALQLLTSGRLSIHDRRVHINTL
ncbi:MAG: phosphoribosylglycinamide formyltransferase [Alphaproteobacteria bacterium]|nr:phosphoribosylglycinamide formyltransferase [Alphaproteobacteria bacterium]